MRNQINTPMEFTDEGILIEDTSKSDIIPLLEATGAEATATETDGGVFVRYDSEDERERELVKLSVKALEEPVLTK